MGAVLLVAGLGLAVRSGFRTTRPLAAAPRTTTTTPPATAASAVTVPLDPNLPRMALHQMTATEGAVAVAFLPRQPGQFLVATLGGSVLRVADGATPVPVADIAAELANGTEQGLLDIAVTPDGTRAAFSFTDRTSALRVDLVPVTADGGLDMVHRRNVFSLAKQHPEHNGGHVVFDGENALWLGTGDGGGLDAGAGDVARNPASLLGKFLHLDLRTGAATVVHRGLRNPWRWSIDPASQTLWIGDVGGDHYEEIDRVPLRAAGFDFGWNRREGRHPLLSRPAAAGTTDPVWEYPHVDRCAVVGGVVYRGRAMPALRGRYLFGDNCGTDVRVLRTDAAGVPVAEASVVPASGVVSFATDPAGEVYVISLRYGVFRLDPA